MQQIRVGDNLPQVTFKTRVRDTLSTDVNPFKWEDKTTNDYFAGQRVVLFGLPGAFTPTCSTYQVPGFERLALEFADHGINNIYCISVNDSFVMNKWAADQNLQNVKVIPDGSAEFTTLIGMDVRKDNLGFGIRSWRYAMIVDDGVVEQIFVEPGIRDNAEDDPYGRSAPENILNYLKDKQEEETHSPKFVNEFFA